MPRERTAQNASRQERRNSGLPSRTRVKQVLAPSVLDDPCIRRTPQFRMRLMVSVPILRGSRWVQVILSFYQIDVAIGKKEVVTLSVWRPGFGHLRDETKGRLPWLHLYGPNESAAVLA